MFGEVGFSPWVNWEARAEVNGRKLPGVYFIARSKNEPKDFRVNNDSIIYIGETTGQTLGDRLRQFNTSAFSVKPGHSGGNTFRETMSHDTDAPMLWVSACPVEMGEVYTSAYIKYLERRLIWEYVCTYGCLPPCNSQ
ncbi:hypothetical protein DET64_10157 [Marinobacter nauticus]|uniref:GIY-YIG domain-containing protein n=1 Tax=Marinobacter nauticus TaxID=2743 RepID=A0A368VFE5_MARNT|nr:hypothetical protein DET64_10157 [Marinobacter nauticus]RCW37721.1 hypothetical protein DET51_10157 [Marinobacter nauticus]